MSEQQNAVISCEGGGMLGVFSSGVVAELDRANIHSSLRAVCGASSGAVPAASLLTRQTSLAFTIFEEFIRSDCVRPERLPHVIAREARWRLYGTPPRREDSLVDVPGAIAAARMVGLNLGALQQQTAGCYVRCLNTQTGRVDFVDMRNHQDPWQVLADGATCLPYYRPPAPPQYIDAMVKEDTSLRQMLEMFPQEKIVIVLNWWPGKARTPLHKMTQFLHGSFSMDWRLLRLYVNKSLHTEQEERLAERHAHRVLIVAPPPDFPVGNLTREPQRLRRGYACGQRAAEKVLRFLGS